MYCVSTGTTPSKTEVIPISEYVRRLKPHLPHEAFAPSPRKSARQIVHCVVILGSYIGIRNTEHWLALLFYSLLIGHSLACTGFFAHELSHNTIFKGSRLRYILEILCWGINLVPPTVWHRVHNNAHHASPNTPSDPDRRFLVSESCRITSWYSRLFYPNNASSKWNLFVGFHFWPYIFRNTAAAFFHGTAKPILVPAKPSYTARERIRVSVEIGAIILIQVAIYGVIGGTPKRFVFASPIALLITSSVVMSYIFTNHFPNPLSLTTDPVINTTSVVVYRICDWLHLNFSYHTEHHLFPGMNSDYYPHVSELLITHYGDRYNRLNFGKAWNLLWQSPLFNPDVNNQTASESRTGA